MSKFLNIDLTLLWFDFKLFFEDIKTNRDQLCYPSGKLWFDFKLFFEDIKTNSYLQWYYMRVLWFDFKLFFEDIKTNRNEILYGDARVVV